MDYDLVPDELAEPRIGEEIIRQKNKRAADIEMNRQRPIQHFYGSEKLIKEHYDNKIEVLQEHRNQILERLRLKKQDFPKEKPLYKNVNFWAIIITIILVLGTLSARPLWLQKDNQPGPNVIQTPTSTLTPTPSSAGKKYNPITGWAIYENDSWGIFFSYPPDWDLKEYKVNEEWNKSQVSAGGRAHPIGELLQINLASSSNSITIRRDGGMGLPPDVKYNHPEYIISGQKANTFENPTDSFLSASVNIGGHDYSFMVSRTSTDKTITDQILGSVLIK